ncbi:MAG TPA: ATP-binding cassette domain-containing protein, partial [Spirochaetia bacterium]|nr:ATP-binding cassette domain-containing protein [Spirochaetia bacterium]
MPGRQVLDGLSLSVRRGAVAVLLGAADAGKTTVSRLIAAQIPRFTGGEVSGSIELHGRDLTGAKPYELLELVGVVSQDSNEQIITARCDTEVAFALESLGLPRRQIVERVDEALDLLGLSGF